MTTHAPPKAAFCCKANSPALRGTNLLFAQPRSCHTSSAICAMPVAPKGCPFEIRPPDGLMTVRWLPYVHWPFRTYSCARPGSLRPSASITSISLLEKQSWTSATLICVRSSTPALSSERLSGAVLHHVVADQTHDRIVVNGRAVRSHALSLDAYGNRQQLWSLIRERCETLTAAAAPSLVGQHCSFVKGSLDLW